MNETQRILTMLQDGTITAPEAEQLLNALQTRQTPQEPTEGALAQPSASLAPSPTPALVKQFHRILEILFGITAAMTAVSGYGVFALYRHADRHTAWSLIGLAILCMLSGLFAMLMLWLRLARWLHVRVWEKNGTRIAISLPIPLTLADWGLRIARRFVDEKTAGYLEMAASFVQAMRHNKQTPGGLMSVEVNDENERVQVSIG